ncbi:hypothetical protein L204_104962 [Cryptococcus depauperatus]|nr:hypothetical protein L204_06469 [Cryptococcus depauperatus CBS 7855]
MAYPIAQQAPPSLAFPFASRPSPLSFNFGLPSTPATSPHKSITHNLPAFSSAYTPHACYNSSATATPTHLSLKRARRSLSPSTSPPASRSQQTSRKSNKHESSMIAQRTIQTTSDRATKPIKRTKLQVLQVEPQPDNAIDPGIMLATMPPSAHLPILLQLLRDNPSLSQSVLSMIPRPDLKTYVKELDGKFAELERTTGRLSSPLPFSGALSEARRWDRATSTVEEYCHMVSTYVQYALSHPQKGAIGTQALFTFLQPITFHLIAILALIPSPARLDQSSLPCPAPLVLNFAKMLLSAWSSWISELSSDVNDKGEMHPHSTVTHWAETLDQVALGSFIGQTVTISSMGHWSSSTPDSGLPQRESALVVSFREAFSSMRDEFLAQVGWLIGRQKVMSM